MLSSPGFNRVNNSLNKIQQSQYFMNSVESTSSSNSLLAAANTLIFNTPGNSSSNSIQSLNRQQANQTNSFLSSNTNLDFDLQLYDYKNGNKNAANFKEPKFDSTIFHLTNRAQKLVNSNPEFGHIFKNDEDDDDVEILNDKNQITDNEEDEDLDNDFDDLNNSLSNLNNTNTFNNNSAMVHLNQIKNDTGQKVGKILENPIRLIVNKSNQSSLGKVASMNMPIENQIKIDSSNKNDNFNQTFNSVTNSTCASFTPTSNLNDVTPQNSVSNRHITTRSRMKLQLMKQQVEQNEKREAAAIHSSSLGHNDIASTLKANQKFFNFAETSTNINNNNNLLNDAIFTNIDIADEFDINLNNLTNMPASFTSSEIIPRSVLPEFYQNETKLDNPTKYHVLQLARNLEQSATAANACREMSSASKKTKKKPINNINNNAKLATKINQMVKSSSFNNSSISNNNNNYSLVENVSLASSGDISVLTNNSSYYTDYLIDENLSIHNSLDSQISNLIDDIVPDDLGSFARKSLNSYQKNEMRKNEQQSLNSPKTLPVDGYLKTMTPPLTPSTARASTSCPADMARMKQLQGLNLTEEEIKTIMKERQKKDNHNMIERRRRFNINDRIKELGLILPKQIQGEIKQNKGSILKASVDYIKNLQNEVVKARELNEKVRQMSYINRKLMSRIKELEMQTTANPSLSAENMREIQKLKQEPQITLFDLVTSSAPSEVTIKDTYQLQSLPPHQQNLNPINNNQYLTSKSPIVYEQQQLQNTQIDFSLGLTNNNNNRIVSTNNNFKVQSAFVSNQQAQFILNESINFDDILSSPIKHQQNDPLLSHSNIYDDSFMDSMN